ncbi:MAG: cysteine--tRNA ligase [Deltaproteobacteria bacterium]|nr:cysteine--tRNA ligase [Deltaproteobacteria bacterium]
MTLKLYNTPHHKKEVFQPIKKNHVSMYVCGPTVYDFCHIGHARSVIVFDVLLRFLRAKGFEVTYVRNFTDIDDKIIKRARELGTDTNSLAEKYINAFHDDMASLYMIPPTFEPRATEHIEGMINMVKTLIDRGHAYVTGNDVYFSVESFKGYGGLSGRNIEDMKAGSRIDVNSNKRHPADFALWKSAKPDEPRWESPWGPGRPGWHLECSVMSNHYLGASFDIHGGGKDLLFPHHENERAQSLCANGGIFAKYWVHNGFVMINSEKMSKSLGNFLTIKDALKTYHPEVLRLFLLSRHYRTPLDFSNNAVMASQSGLIKIYRTLKRLEALIGHVEPLHTDATINCLADKDTLPATDSLLTQFSAAMDEDLNTAEAIGIIFEKVREINRVLNSVNGPLKKDIHVALTNDRHQIYVACYILGLLNETPDDFFEQINEKNAKKDRADINVIKQMINDRNRARTEKNWAKADEIRDRLKEMGVILEDGPEGTTWRFDL